MLDLARSTGLPALPWLTMSVIGLLCAGAIAALQRTRRLSAPGLQPAVG
ncbi:hypothetical protein LZ318_39485 [Saccharopolyspora indica]|nr:hypothetical protein [Saccharopolyspora indica]MDA3642552.1 hypothetical protein [Saccharopolyspora indica]